MKKFILGVLLVVGMLNVSYSLTDKQESLLLQSLGNSISTGAYSMYISIGGVADLYGNDFYKIKTAKSIIGALSLRCETLQKYLNKLLDHDVITGSDVKFLEGVIDTYGYLQKEADTYLEYIDDTTDENFDVYNKNRKKAWSGIEKMMGWDKD